MIDEPTMRATVDAIRDAEMKKMNGGPGHPTGKYEPVLEMLAADEPRGNSFRDFMHEVMHVLDSKAEVKGYSDTGADGENALFNLTDQAFPGHAMGEVVYKAVRYARKGNEEDLFKAVAWCYLKWRASHKVRVR